MLPTFQYNLHAPLNFTVCFNFYEKKYNRNTIIRYVEMINMALHSNLMFVIDFGQSFCDIYEIVKINRNNDKRTYYCEAKNIGKGLKTDSKEV